jgi:hypothetical protein
MTIQEIMQVGVGMPDCERFANFTRDMLGFPATRSPDGKITYVRADRYQHRIAARTAPQPILSYVASIGAAVVVRNAPNGTSPSSSNSTIPMGIL